MKIFFPNELASFKHNSRSCVSPLLFTSTSQNIVSFFQLPSCKNSFSLLLFIIFAVKTTEFMVPLQKYLQGILHNLTPFKIYIWKKEYDKK